MIFVPPPSFWSKKQRYIPIPENATEEQLNNINARNKEISFNNRICANVKPYFFGYVYDREMKRYKEHKDKYNSISLKICHKNLSDILLITSLIFSISVGIFDMSSPVISAKLFLNLSKLIAFKF